jgi:hypothetical protein
MKLYVGAVVKNHEATWHHFQKLLETLFQTFPGTIACVYEDNSTDATPRLLAEFQAAHPTEFFYISEAYDQSQIHIRTWDNKPYRVHCIALARNKLMEVLEGHGLGSAGDLCMMVDPDVPNGFVIETILATLQNFPAEAHAIFANGISRTGCYYDGFAYRDMNYPFGVDLYGEHNRDRYLALLKQLRRPISFNEPLIPVMSAFGGIGIYRAEAIKGHRYSATPTAALDRLYRTIYKHFPQHAESVIVKKIQENPETHVRGCLLGIYLHQPKEEGGFFYFNCCGANYPIVCEHITFHAEMIAAGYDKLFVCPQLIYLSDHY